MYDWLCGFRLRSGLKQACNCVCDDLWSVYGLIVFTVADGLEWPCIGLKSRCMIWIIVDHGSSLNVVGGRW